MRLSQCSLARLGARPALRQPPRPTPADADATCACCCQCSIGPCLCTEGALGSVLKPMPQLQCQLARWRVRRAAAPCQRGGAAATAQPRPALSACYPRAAGCHSAQTPRGRAPTRGRSHTVPAACTQASLGPRQTGSWSPLASTQGAVRRRPLFTAARRRCRRHHPNRGRCHLAHFRRRRARWALLVLVGVVAGVGPALGCTTIAVGKDASDDGSRCGTGPLVA